MPKIKRNEDITLYAKYMHRKYIRPWKDYMRRDHGKDFIDSVMPVDVHELEQLVLLALDRSPEKCKIRNALGGARRSNTNLRKKNAGLEAKVVELKEIVLQLMTKETDAYDHQGNQ